MIQSIVNVSIFLTLGIIMARTITFQPSRELGKFVEGLIETGDYSNTSEVVREGLRLLQEKKAKSKLQQLRSLIDEGENSGDLVSWSVDEFLQKVKKDLNGR